MKRARAFHKAAVGPRQLAPGESRPPLRLRAAVEQILAARAARRAGSRPKGVKGATREAPRTLRRLAQPRCLNFTVSDRRLHAGEMPTVELLDAALALLSGGQHQPGDRRRENWFFGVAVRAVSAALAQAGRVWLPIGVHFLPAGGSTSFTESLLLPASSRVKARPLGEGLHLVLRLEDPTFNPDNAPPLAALLDAAFLVFDGYHQPGRWHGHPWFFRQALREVSLAVLKEGCLAWPLRVRLDQPATLYILGSAGARTPSTRKR